MAMLELEKVAEYVPPPKSEMVTTETTDNDAPNRTAQKRGLAEEERRRRREQKGTRDFEVREAPPERPCPRRHRRTSKAAAMPPVPQAEGRPGSLGERALVALE